MVLMHERRRVVHFNVTEHPTASWTAQQIVEAFPWDTAPRYLLRDNDCIFSEQFSSRVAAMQIKEKNSLLISLAESILRADHRLNPSRLPRSRDHLQ